MIDGQMDGWTNKCVDERNRWMDRQINRRMNRWTDRWMDQQKDRWTEKTDGRADGPREAKMDR
jgi:hypothetical protein